MKKRLKLRKEAKILLVKMLITLALGIADLVLYHYLVVIGSYVGETSWASTFCLVGWFWLIAGQFIALHGVWE